MKNWKKLTAAALAALALVGTLAGCGNNADKKPDTKQATKIVTDLKGRSKRTAGCEAYCCCAYSLG